MRSKNRRKRDIKPSQQGIEGGRKNAFKIPSPSTQFHHKGRLHDNNGLYSITHPATVDIEEIAGESPSGEKVGGETTHTDTFRITFGDHFLLF